MKRFLLFLGIILSAVAVKAQSTEQTPEQRAHNQTMRMKKIVNLSDDQSVKVEAVFLAQAQELQKIQNNNTLSKEEKQKQIDDVKAAKDKEIQGILSPEQYNIYEAKKKEAEERRNSAH